MLFTVKKKYVLLSNSSYVVINLVNWSKLLSSTYFYFADDTKLLSQKFFCATTHIFCKRIFA